MAEDFEARHDGRVIAFDGGGDVGFLQFAVDAIADAKFFFERLDVDVSGPQVEGLGKNLVDELDDRRIFGRLGQIEFVIGCGLVDNFHFIVVH